MIPYALLLSLAGLGTPNIAPGKELNVRAAAVEPKYSCYLGIWLNWEGEFTFGTADETDRPQAHHRLKIRKSRSRGTVTGLEPLVEIARGDAFGNTLVGMATMAVAIGKCQEWLKSHSTDTDMMIQLGALLDMVDQAKAAELWIRQANRIAPRDWATWHALATYHLNQVCRLLYPNPETTARWRTGNYDLTRLDSDLLTAPANVAKEVDRHLHAATDCYDQSVVFAPDAVEPYFERYQWYTSMAAIVMVERDRHVSREAAAQECIKRVSRDVRKIAELSGHPLAYGLILYVGAPELLAGKHATMDRDWQKFGERATLRLEAMRRDPDPITRMDATRSLIIIRMMVFRDLTGAKRLLDELPVQEGERTNIALAAFVYYCGSQTAEEGNRELADHIERTLRVRGPLDYYLLAECRERAGNVSKALVTVREGLRAHPNDVRLNLTRTGMLLQYGTAADLLEVHFRLTRLEDYYTTRLMGKNGTRHFPDDWTKQDAALMQLYSLHRAVYLGLLGRTEWALYFANHAKDLSDKNAETAAKLVQELDPSTKDNSKPKPLLEVPNSAGASTRGASMSRPVRR